MTRKALLIIDLQNDYTEGGPLALPGASETADKITTHATGHLDEYVLVVATRDLHKPDHTNGGHVPKPGAEPGPGQLPVHCVLGTPGAEYVPELAKAVVDVHIIKGIGEPGLSAFTGVGDDTAGQDLAGLLAAADVSAVDVTGFGPGVAATALDAIRHGYDVSLLAGMIRLGSVDAQLEQVVLAAAGAGPTS